MRAIFSVYSVALLISLFTGAVSADTVTIDFEDAPAEMAVSPGFLGTYETQGYDLVSTYCCWAVISQPVQLNNKALLAGAWGFDFNLYGNDFSLVSFDIGFLAGKPGIVELRGYRDGSQVITETINTPVTAPLPDGYQTIQMGAGWENLDRLYFYIRPVACCPDDPAALDNIVLSSEPTPVDIVVNPLTPDGQVHTNHDGSASGGTGLDDMIDVVVLGSSTLVGDPVDFDASDIDPATLRFGPGEGGIAPGTSPVFDVDIDSDGIDDAKFNVLTGDSGIQCSDTDAELTGETNSGQEFSGIDTISTNCDALCHN